MQWRRGCPEPEVSPGLIRYVLGVPTATGFEVRFANGQIETTESLWAARHLIAQRVAFASDPTRPADVLPAKVWQTGPGLFGGRAFLEEIRTAAELSETG